MHSIHSKCGESYSTSLELEHLHEIFGIFFAWNICLLFLIYLFFQELFDISMNVKVFILNIGLLFHTALLIVLLKFLNSLGHGELTL